MHTTLEKLYLAFIEEKCHLHPTSPVRFDLEEDYDLGTTRISVVVGSFDCGLCFTDGDILRWIVEKDIKPSEVKDYKVEIMKNK